MNLEKDKISVIMSTYNTKKEYLNISIKSILNQTYKNIEFIIVCDGLNEEYQYIKDNFIDKRIILTYNKKNKGLSYSLNKAIKMAKGKYIARMDSDDISLKNRLVTQFNFMEKNPQIEICGMYAKCFGDVNYINRLFHKKTKEISAELLFTSVLYHPTVIFKKSFFKKNIFYNTDYKCAQDFELWTRASLNNNIAVIPKIGLYYRVHKKQASQKKSKIQKKYTQKILKKNALKISKNKTEALNFLKVLELLRGFNSINKDNYLFIADEIKKIIKVNNYEEKAIKNVFYNRYSILMIKNKLFIQTINPKIFPMVYNLNNLNYLFWKINTKILDYLEKLFDWLIRILKI